MGCGGSKPADHRKEAEEYAKRKKMGFKDPGLEQVRKDAVRQKKKLKHVEDPYNHRNEKIDAIKAEQKKKGGGNAGSAGRNKNNNKTATPTTAGYGCGLSEDAIQAQRNKLKPVKR